MCNPYKIPRAAYCTGCGVTFPQMHLMINHRRLKRCGGRFLPDEEVIFLLMAKYWRQRAAQTNSHQAYLEANQYRIALSRARHDRHQEEKKVVKVPAKLVFGTDYTDLEAVIKLAEGFGGGHTVIKHPDRPNYNIVHTSRHDLYAPDWVMHVTKARASKRRQGKRHSSDA